MSGLKLLILVLFGHLCDSVSSSAAFTYPHLISGSLGDIRHMTLDVSSTNKLVAGGRCSESTLCASVDTPLAHMIDLT